MLTLDELYVKLKDYDEVMLIDILKIDSTEIVEAFKDKIDEDFEKIIIEISEDLEEDEDET